MVINREHSNGQSSNGRTLMICLPPRSDGGQKTSLPPSLPAATSPLAKALAMTSATAAIPGSASFQSATRARAVVSAGPAQEPDVQSAASRIYAATASLGFCRRSEDTLCARSSLLPRRLFQERQHMGIDDVLSSVDPSDFASIGAPSHLLPRRLFQERQHMGIDDVLSSVDPKQVPIG
jgi:hypothetical protein